MLKANAGKIPAFVATSTVTSLMLLGSVPGAAMSTSSQYQAINEPAAMIRYLSDGFDHSTSSATMRFYEGDVTPVDAFEAANEMFGTMRSSTKEEMALYETMLDDMSTPVGLNIFSL